MPGSKPIATANIKILSPKATCGLFGISEDYIEEYQSLDERFNKNPSATFFFEAVGDSMEPTIRNKDIILVDRSIEHFHKRVCVVSYQGQLICKRVLKNSNGLVLRSDNPSHKDIEIVDSQDLVFWGVVGSYHGDIL